VSRWRVLAYMTVIQTALVAVAWAIWGGVFGVVMIVMFVAADILSSAPLRPRRWPATRTRPEESVGPDE